MAESDGDEDGLCAAQEGLEMGKNGRDEVGAVNRYIRNSVRSGGYNVDRMKTCKHTGHSTLDRKSGNGGRQN